MPALEIALAELGSHVGLQRDSILFAWREAIKKDPTLTTGNTLPAAQLYDHIPALLRRFEHELGRWRGSQVASADSNEDAAAHGLQRWQQGYDLREVTRELGRLNECVVLELDVYGKHNPQLEYDVMATARRLWASLYGIGVEESTAQYFRIQQTEASGHLRDLESALEAIKELEQQRAVLWWQAAHDLRGNLSVVATATAGLARPGLHAPVQENFLGMLKRNVSSLHHLLDDVTGLARLQAGREVRQLTRLDIAPSLHEWCDGMRPMAEERHLFMRYSGPPTLPIEGDAVKIRRIAQNLFLNAIKYTRSGGVTVSWGDSDGDDGKRWALIVKDTGPGFHTGSGAPLAGALADATSIGQAETADAGNVAASAVAPTRVIDERAGEGIGLSIVKRLCELLDATIELESTLGVGTTFRILIPRRYTIQPSTHPG